MKWDKKRQYGLMKSLICGASWDWSIICIRLHQSDFRSSSPRALLRWHSVTKLHNLWNIQKYAKLEFQAHKIGGYKICFVALRWHLVHSASKIIGSRFNLRKYRYIYRLLLLLVIKKRFKGNNNYCHHPIRQYNLEFSNHVEVIALNFFSRHYSIPFASFDWSFLNEKQICSNLNLTSLSRLERYKWGCPVTC